MKPELIITTLIVVGCVIGLAMLLKKKRKNTEPIEEEAKLPILKTQDDKLIAFQPIEALSPEEENALIPVTDKMVIQRVMDSIPKTGQVAVNAANAAKAAELVNGGIYQAIIPQGAVLDSSRAMEGAFRGSYRQVANSIKGNANWVPVDKSVNQLAVANAANAVMGTASMVVGQYYMAQISSQLETVNSNISSISRHLDNEFYSKVMQLALDVKNISEFKGEIFENDQERERILGKLSDLESQCEQLLIQTNKHLDDLSKTNSSDYDSYESNVRKTITWYQYQKGLTDILNAISELRYGLNNGVLSKEYTHSKYYVLADQSFQVRKALESWHTKNVERFGIDTELAHRDRKGLNAVAWWLPGRFNDELNYKSIDAGTAKTIKRQTTDNGINNMLLDDPYNRDVVLIEKEGKYYYLPENHNEDTD